MKTVSIVAVLALASFPMVAPAQTFFASGSTSNAANPVDSVGVGSMALATNANGTYNSAVGYWTLRTNTTGNKNSALGAYALYGNSTGSGNSALGFSALQYNSTGAANSAVGAFTLFSNTVGANNVAEGYYALFANTAGAANVAVGVSAMNNNGTGSYNTALGSRSLYTSNGSYNIAIGYQAGTNLVSGSNNIIIGNTGTSSDSGLIRMGTSGTHTKTFIAGINGVTSSSGVPVYINANGQLGTITSSRRFKNDIKSMGTQSDPLLKLRAVTFRYKTADETGAHPLQYGLIAEVVAKVAPDLVQYDKAGKPFTVRYHLLTPMLLNELQKERAARKAEVVALRTKVACLEQVQAKQLMELVKQVAELKAAQQRGKSALAVLH